MKTKISKGKIYCLISVAIIFGFYILERVLDVCLDITREMAIVEAIVYSLSTALVYFLVTKSKEPFYGILTAIFGFRMMPTKITGLSALSEEAGLVYFIVQKFSLIIFAIAIIKLYRLQKTPREIRPLPILITIVAVPFCTEVYSQVADSLTNITGSMLYGYFACFIIYSLTMLVLLFCAVRTNFQSARLIINYELVALALNIGRRICTVLIWAVQGTHISKSYYCWIAIYSFFFLAFLLLRIKKQKLQLNQ